MTPFLLQPSKGGPSIFESKGTVPNAGFFVKGSMYNANKKHNYPIRGTLT